jgi:hypothetical protein
MPAAKLLYKVNIDVDVDCWYLDKASITAVQEDIKAGDLQDWNSQARKVIKAACTPLPAL